MLDTFRRLIERLGSDAYDPLAIVVELLLIGLSVNWCASILQGTRGTRMLRGLLIVLVVVTLIVRVLSVQMGWTRLELLYRYFVYGLAFIALVAFQPELRRAFIRAGDVRFARRGLAHGQAIAALAESAAHLSRNKHGALIAVQREVGLRNWAEQGIRVDAEISAALLNSMFFPNSPLHDLGVIVQGTRVTAANCQFPQIESGEADPSLGSRHRAAIAMSSESDALVVVVSEETGTISMADNGKLIRPLSPAQLQHELQHRMSGRRPDVNEREGGLTWRASAWRVLRRVLVVVPVSAVIWMLTDQASLSQVDGVRVAIAIAADPSLSVSVRRPTPTVFSVSFRGSNRAIERLRADSIAGQIVLEWPLPESCRAPGEYFLNAMPIVEELKAVRSRGLVVQSVSPGELAFDVDRLVTARLPVHVETGAVRVADVRTEPAEVEVAMRAADLARLTPEQRFVAAALGERATGAVPGAERMFENVPLERRVGGSPVARLEPAAVRVALRVVGQSVERKLAGVVVQLSASPQVLRRYDVELTDPNEWLIDLTLEGERVVVDGLRPADVRALVAISGDSVGSGDAQTAEVQIIVPPGVRVVGPPRQVRFRLTPHEVSR